MLMTWITSKLAGPIAIGVSILLGITLAVTTVKLAGARHHAETLQGQVTKLTDQIENPLTGWRVRLQTCHTNNDKLTAALKDQSAQVQATADQMQAKIAGAMAIAQKARQGEALATAKLTMLSSVPVTGDSCKDAAAIDAALLEGLR